MRPEAWARCKVHAGLHRDSWTLRSLVGLGLCWLGQVAKTKPGGKVGCPPHVRSRRPGMAEPSHRAPQLLACLHLAKVSTLACLRRCACKGCPRDPTRPGLPALAAAGGGWPGCQVQASPSGARGPGLDDRPRGGPSRRRQGVAKTFVAQVLWPAVGLPLPARPRDSWTGGPKESGPPAPVHIRSPGL